MSSTTTNLGLYKANPVTDKDNTFNIDTILNDNWDKIDANVAKKSEIPTIPTTLPANGGNSTTVNNHTAAATSNTDEKIDLIGMINEVKAGSTTQVNDLKTSAITSDYTGKIAGSNVENPNICKWSLSATSLLSPSGTWNGELATSEYTNISTIDGNCVNSTTTTNGIMPQQLFEFNLISIVERKYGTIPGTTADKVAWLKNNINSITCNLYGYGSCPSGNKATLKIYYDNSWAFYGSNTSSTVSEVIGVSYRNNNEDYVTPVINNDGFLYLVVYTDASDGTIPSTISTDYISLRIEFKDGMSLLLQESNSVDYVRHPGYAVTSGTSTAYTITLNPAPTAYVDGQQFTILPHVDCGANPTLNVNGLGALAIVKQDDSTISAGEIKANKPLSLVRVGSNFFMRSCNESVIKSIQSGIATIATGGSFINIPIAPVNINNAIVIVNNLTQGSTSPVYAQCFPYGVLLDNQTIQIKIGTGTDTSSNNMAYTWKVIEFNNVKSLQKGLCAVQGSNTDITVSSVNTSKCLLFCTQIVHSYIASPQFYYYELTSATNIKIFSNIYDTGIINFYWQLIEFN